MNTNTKLILGGLTAFFAYKFFSKPKSAAPPTGGSAGGSFQVNTSNAVQWTPQKEAQAKVAAQQVYAEVSTQEDFTTSPEFMFVVARDVANILYPGYLWPKTPAAAAAMTDALPTSIEAQERAWVVQAINAGQPGHAMSIVWDKILQTAVWPVFGYTPI